MRKMHNNNQRGRKMVSIFLVFLLSFLLLFTAIIYTLPPGNHIVSQLQLEKLNQHANQLKEMMEMMEIIAKKIETEIRQITEDDPNPHALVIRFKNFLQQLTELVKFSRSLLLKLPRMDDDLINQPSQSQQGSFLVEEMNKYIEMKPNRLGKKNFMGANGTFPSIGHGCFAMKKELEEYMTYDVGDICKDDWKLAQKLSVHGCDPLPRRRCFSTTPKFYTRPSPIHQAAWTLPDDRNVRWSHYRCKNFACLANTTQGGFRKGFFKCADCFNLTHHEKPRWMRMSSQLIATSSEFSIEEVVGFLPAGEIRIGLDFSVGTGSFAIRMRDLKNVTIISATINLGAPFSEMIALRGVVPMYLTVNQRLPFLDNTLDIIHSTRFLDGWIDLILLDFVLYDWDRVLRPGGLLWIDSFFCLETDRDVYLDAFKMLRYKIHKWLVIPKLDKDVKEIFFSAVLAKPLRPF
ncbi:S-adenosyl-L-methionine-dependent methyltransferases superfamilyprotein [Zostera marina]|uniref:S-adenosyl-L-methionine-dependent methyltransferases superfamilyprotein n=1 Tax=Zostera marina TaxID=29655 RepID=A0A0K9PMA9_ZOSMR|nr:S-adenosyl-L-methionine-dependent methyltransferases superfamilyprotein [Zostera marina]